MMEHYLKNIKNGIYSSMAKEDLSLSMLAQKCGLTENGLLYIISGKRKNIRLSTIIKISEGTKIPISKLIGECE